MADLASIVEDLRAEGDALDALVADLTDHCWSMPTPAPGWTVAHQIGHLSWTDNVAERTTSGAAGDPAAAAEFDATLSIVSASDDKRSHSFQRDCASTFSARCRSPEAAS